MVRNEESFEKDFKSAEGNVIHEGMKCTEEEKELIKLKYLGLISEEEFIRKTLILISGKKVIKKSISL